MTRRAGRRALAGGRAGRGNFYRPTRPILPLAALAGPGLFS